jgi:hypothetical protein
MFGARHRLQRDPLLSADLDAGTQTTPLSRRRRHLSAARPATTWSSFAGPGRGPSREFSGAYGSPAPWEADAGQARLAELSRCAMTTPVLTSVEATENMAIAAGKGAKAQKIGLKEQASRWSSAYPIACRCRLWWESPQRDAGRGGDCAASQPRVLAARSRAQPPRERSGRQTLRYDAPDSAAPPGPVSASLSRRLRSRRLPERSRSATSATRTRSTRRASASSGSTVRWSTGCARCGARARATAM